MIFIIKHGKSEANVFPDNGVPESAICGWLRDEHKLCHFVDTVNSTERKKVKTVPKTYNLMGSFHMFCEGEADWHPN